MKINRRGRKPANPPGGSSAAAAEKEDEAAGPADATPPARDPTLPRAEQEGRQQWRDAPEDLKEELMKVHRAFNHPPNVTLARIIHRAGGKPEAVKFALLLRCDACDANQKNHKHPRVTAASEVPI